jgi:hypothetical protein
MGIPLGNGFSVSPGVKTVTNGIPDFDLGSCAKCLRKVCCWVFSKYDLEI